MESYSTAPNVYNNQQSTASNVYNPSSYVPGYDPEHPAMDYQQTHYPAGYYNNNVDNPNFQYSGFRSSYDTSSRYTPYDQPEQYFKRKHEKKGKRTSEEKKDRKRDHYYRHKSHRSRKYYTDDDDNDDDDNYKNRYSYSRSEKRKPTEKDMLKQKTNTSSSDDTIKPITITDLDQNFFEEFNNKLKLQGHLLDRMVFPKIPMIINSNKKTLEIRDKRILWYFLGAYDSYKVHQYMEGQVVSPQNVLSLILDNDQERCKKMIDHALESIEKSDNSYDYLIHVSKNRMIHGIGDINVDDVCSEANVMKEPTASFYSSAEKETMDISNVGRKSCFLQMSSVEHKWYTLGFTFRNKIHLYKHQQQRNMN